MTFDKEDTKIIKGIAICLMLYHHLFGFPDRIAYDYYSIFGSSYNILGHYGKMCVGLFFFLGAYGMYKSYKNNYFTFVKNRIISVYKSFWKVFFIVVPISLLLSVPSVTLNIKSFLGNFLGYDLTYNGEWWFLATYLLIIPIGPLLFKLFGKCYKFYHSVIIFCVIYILCLITFNKIFSLSFLDNYRFYMWFYYVKEVFNWLPVFVMGIIFAKYDVLDLVKKYFTNNYLMSISSLVWIIFTVLLREKLRLSLDFIYVPIFIIASTIILSLPIMKLLRKCLYNIGNNSTNMWLTHSFFCYKWCQGLIFMPRLGGLIFLLLLIVSYFFSLFIDKFYELLDTILQIIRKKL